MIKNLISAIIIGLAAGISLITLSCSTGACFDETNSYLKATLYSYSTKKSVTPDSISLYGLNRGSDKFYDKASGIQPALFPLDDSTGSCAFVIVINGNADTLTFTYSSYPHLISKECGLTFYHNLNNWTSTYHGIDSVSIKKNKITTANEENIRIYY